MNLENKTYDELNELLAQKKSELLEYTDMLSRFPVGSKLGYWSLSAYIRKLQKQIKAIESYLER